MADSIYHGAKYPMYVRTPTTSPDGLKPEAELADQAPQRGMLVFTSNPNFPQGEVLPTAAIQELLFASHQVFKDDSRHSNDHINVAIVTGMDLIQSWKVSAEAAKGSPAPSNTLDEAMAPWVAKRRLEFTQALEAVKKSNLVIQGIPDFGTVGTPNSVTYQGGIIETTKPLNTYLFAEDMNNDGTLGSSGIGKPNAWVGSEVLSIKNAWDDLARAYAEVFYDSFMTAEGLWMDKLAAREDWPVGTVDSLVSVFNNEIAKGLVTPTNAPRIKAHRVKKVKGKGGKAGNGSVLIPTPVFPISDARGYTVVGSYRYGRDVTIDPDGVFDVLHRMDIFSMLNKTLVDNIMRSVTAGVSIDADTQRKATEVFRRNWSDADLASKGWLSPNGEINFTNAIADGKDGITKLPIVNAAYALADLAPHTSRDFCSCKAAEASVLLDIAGTREFVQFTEAGKANYGTVSGEPSVDRTIQWIKETTTKAGIPWAQSQDALRGSVPNQGPTSIINAVHGGSESQARNLDAQRAAFEASKQLIRDIQDPKKGG
jgi:hypothetical protein